MGNNRMKKLGKKKNEFSFEAENCRLQLYETKARKYCNTQGFGVQIGNDLQSYK